uniref:Uncharacterized protein n=1 Tax=Anguilla anguilla TaxID=7936 RepID=A0A0E9XIG6_ANGAN
MLTFCPLFFSKMSVVFKWCGSRCLSQPTLDLSFYRQNGARDDLIPHFKGLLYGHKPSRKEKNINF